MGKKGLVGRRHDNGRHAGMAANARAKHGKVANCGDCRLPDFAAATKVSVLFTEDTPEFFPDSIEPGANTLHAMNR